MGSATATRSFGSTDARVRLAAVVAVVAALALAAPAQAQRVMGEARVSGGFDSNPSLAVDPGNRRLPQNAAPTPPPPPAPGRPPPDPTSSMEDGVFRVGGFLGGEIGDDLLRGQARLDLDGRVYGSGDAMFWERLHVGARLVLDPVSPRCGLDGERFDTSFTADDAWTLTGSCGARVGLPLGFWLTVDGFGGGRFFDVGQVDTLYGGVVGGGWAWEILRVEVAFLAMRRDSDEEQAARTELSPSVTVRVDTAHVGGELAYRYVERLFDQGSRSGGEHVGRLVAWGMPLPWIGGFAELELGHANGGPQALSYDRVQVVGGVRLVLDWRPEPDRLPPPDDAQGPATVLDDGRVRFRFAIEDAASVAVVGSFNGWDPEAGRLRAVNGAFEGTFAVPPGRHQYAILVDGEPRRPPGAPRYVADDFGGENAVLVVSEP